MVPREDETLAAYLADRDVRCARCRYNLRGLTRSTCPECGLALRLSDLQTEEIRHFALAGLVTAPVVAGLWVVFILVLASDPLAYVALWIPGALLVGWLPAAVLWRCSRRGPVQRWLVLSVGVLGFGLAGLGTLALLAMAVVYAVH
jgi:hypothetical protein